MMAPHGVSIHTARIKLLGKGEISIPVTLKIDRVSESARQKIEAAGGTVEVLPLL